MMSCAGGRSIVGTASWAGVLALSTLMIGSGVAQSGDLAQAVTYVGIDRESSIRVTKDGMEWGRLPSSTEAQTGKMLVDSAPIMPVVDCSDRDFHCVRFLHLLAVPRSGLVRDQTYEVIGASFRVEECRFEIAGRCGIALVSVECIGVPPNDAEKEPYGRCIEARDAKGMRPSYFGYFLFNQSIGVTAFGFDIKEARTRAEMIEIMSGQLLEGSRGLLYPAEGISKAR